MPIEIEYQALTEFREWLHERRENIPKESTFYKKVKWKIATIPFLKKMIKKAPPLSWENGIGFLRASLGNLLLKEYPTVVAKRNKNYFLFEKLMQGENKELLYKSPKVTPAWLKAKLIIPDLQKEEVDILGKYMCSKGFRVGRFNWSQTLSQSINLSTYAGGVDFLPDSERFANLSLDFPIHQNMTEEDIKSMVNILKLEI